jgi:putative transposase
VAVKGFFVSEFGKVVDSSDEAAGRLAAVLSDEGIDNLLADAESSGMPVDGVGGLLNRLTSRVLERALEAEMSDHLGYDAGDPAGRGSGSSRNGCSAKTVVSTAGPVSVTVPGDRHSTFVPQIVPKHARRIGAIEDIILSLYARGLSTREI